MYNTNRNRYIIKENYAVLQILFKSEWVNFLVDLDDVERLQNRTWRTTHKKRKIYAVSGEIKYNTYIYLHKFILDVEYKKGFEIDHINGDSQDNRKVNLRICTRLTNIQNTSVRHNNKIGIRGITYNPNWHSYIVDFSYNKQRYYFPHWKTIEDAVWCRKTAEEYYGLSIIARNPTALQYYTLSQNRRKEIEYIVVQNIAKATV